MSLLLKGVTRLSGLEIDSDKNWDGHLIQNLGAAVEDADALKKAQSVLQSLLSAKGDMLYRGNSEAARLSGSYGNGFNFLHMTSSGQLEPEWLDIQDLFVYLTGAVNRMALPPRLLIPAPSVIAPEVAEDHSGGGNEAAPALNVPVPSVSAIAELV